MKITLRQLLYFDALARTLHFGKAAASVNISQPALSAQIMDMEDRLQCELVERRHGNIVLTDSGQRLLPHVRKILGDVQSLEEMVLQDRGLMVGTLRVGIIPTVAPYILPRLVPHLEALYPELTLKIREATTDVLIDELTDGTLDAVIAAEPIHVPSLHAHHLFDDRFFIAGPPGSTGAPASPLAEDQIPLDDLLLLNEGHCLRDQALAICGAKTALQTENFGATSMNTVLQLVSNGMGITLLPQLAIPAECQPGREIAITPFVSPEPSRKIAMFWRTATERTPDFETLARSVATVGDQVLLQAIDKIENEKSATEE